MTDTYPETIEIEINRPALTKYLRQTWLRLCCYLTIPSGLVGFAIAMGRIDREPALLHMLPSFLLHDVGIGMGVGLLIGLLLYMLRGHHAALRRAEGLHVRVEGSFLQIEMRGRTVTDRRIHFRSIIDYIVEQTPRMRSLGIYTLILNTPGSGPSGRIMIHGIKNGPEARDMLADVDRLREVR